MTSLGEKLISERIPIIVDFCLKNGKINNTSLRQLLRLGRNGARLALKQCVRKGILVRINTNSSNNICYVL
jgi:predicted HTH transcriptional regulator